MHANVQIADFFRIIILSLAFLKNIFDIHMLSISNVFGVYYSCLITLESICQQAIFVQIVQFTCKDGSSCECFLIRLQRLCLTESTR